MDTGPGDITVGLQSRARVAEMRIVRECANMLCVYRLLGGQTDTQFMLLLKENTACEGFRRYPSTYICEARLAADVPLMWSTESMGTGR